METLLNDLQKTHPAIYARMVRQHQEYLEVRQGLERALQTLTNELTQCHQELEGCKSQLEAMMAQAQQSKEPTQPQTDPQPQP